MMLSLSSCSIFNKKTTSAKPSTSIPEETVGVDIQGINAEIEAMEGEWAVIELNGRQLKIDGDNRPMFTFNASPDVAGQVNVIGFNGCNYINGSYKVGTGKLTKAGEFLTSLMSCPDAPYETEINQALEKVTGYSISRIDDSSTLRLTDAPGRTLILLRNHTLGFLNGAWKVERIDNRTVPSSADIKVVVDTHTRTIHGNAGCNLLNGEIIINLDVNDGLEFSNLSTTRMTCPDIDTERAFLVALESVATAHKVDADNVSLLDDKGATVISLSRIDPASLAEE